MVCRTKIDTIEEFDRLRGIPESDSLASYNFENYEFSIKLTLSDTDSLSFKNCLFKEDVKFPSRIKNDSFLNNSVFEKKAIFTNTTFEDDIRFHSTKFLGGTEFNNACFEKLADFWSASFKEVTIFYKTSFLGTTIFSSTSFHKNVLFTNSYFGKLAIFRATVFKKGFDFSLAVISGELSIFDLKIDINAFDDIRDTHSIDKFKDYVAKSGKIPRKNKRESLRIIKNICNKNHNTIEALEFTRHEMNTYVKQLEQRIYKERKIKETQNLVLLYLNGISSRHGTSWWRGILFTVTIGILFFYFSIIATDNYTFGIKNINMSDYTSSVRYFFTFMFPTHKIGYLDSEKPKVFFYLWDFLGRLFVSYGIYQTVQAFRKYKSR